jgi:hypothetical protein
MAFARYSRTPGNTRPLKVQLRYASLPSVLGLIASHYWFVVLDGDEAHRWEVWQTKDAGGRSIGHVHCDLKAPDAGVGGGPARIAAEWTGAEALSRKKVLEEAHVYPFCHRYRYWPGPNSNTFAAWVLRQAGIQHPLARRAIGRNYRC